jgi:hypothetical protein
LHKLTGGCWVLVPAGSGQGYGVVNQSPTQPAAGTADPRFGVPPRIAATQQTPTAYSQESYGTPGSQAQGTQYSTQAPAAAQPTQYSGMQTQYPSQAPNVQQGQYATSNQPQAAVCSHMIALSSLVVCEVS